MICNFWSDVSVNPLVNQSKQSAMSSSSKMSRLAGSQSAADMMRSMPTLHNLLVHSQVDWLDGKGPLLARTILIFNVHSTETFARPIRNSQGTANPISSARNRFFGCNSMRSATPDIISDSEDGESINASNSGQEERLYTQLVLYAGGQFLALLFVLLVYNIWAVLEGYKDALLWALLCSVALREAKTWLVDQCLIRLSQERTLLGIGIELVCLPLCWLKEGTEDIWHFFDRWRKYAEKYEEDSKERVRNIQQAAINERSRPPAQQVQSQNEQAAGAEHADTRLRSQPRTKRGRIKKRRKPSKLPEFLAGLVEIGHLGLKAWRNPASQQCPPLVQPPGSSQGSSHSLIRGLLVACIGYQLLSWFSTAHVLILTGTAAVSISLLPFLYLGGHLYLSLADPERGLASKSSNKGQQRWSECSQLGAEGDAHGNSQGRLTQKLQKRSQVRVSSLERLHRKYRTLDARTRATLASYIHSIVAAILVVSVIAGSLALVVFLSVRIGQESSAAVMTATEAAAAWTKTASNSTALLATKTPWQRWVLQHRASLQQLQESLPSAALSASEWAEHQISNFVKAHNLTQVVDDIKSLHSTFVPPKSCSPDQKRLYLIRLAQASAHAQQRTMEHNMLADEIKLTRESLSEELQTWEAHQTSTTTHTHSPMTDPLKAQTAVISLDRRLAELEQAHTTAHRAMDDATDKARRAKQDLARCDSLQSKQSTEEQSLVMQQLGQQLEDAYAHIWKMQFREGLQDLRDLVRQVAAVATQILQGDGDIRELSSLQRLGRAAAEPLLSLAGNLAGVLMSSTYSTTTLAVTGGLGAVKLGIGLLKFGVQTIVFLALLFYLLAAESDPLSAVAKLLPLSAATRQRASTAFSRAMRGVFVCAIKLATFHALFTWLSFRLFSVHLVYLSTLLSAVFATLPFIPSWLVALPAAAQLALLQQRPMAASLLLGLHFCAWYIADDLIFREIPNSHPYLSGLGIFGGIATFANPLQGALIGPLLLSFLSLLYNLHLASRAEPLSSRLTPTPGSSGQLGR